jgi:hypothetical protein
VRPDLYDLIPEPVGPSDALEAARWVTAGAALAMLVQLVLGALGLVRPRVLVGGLAAVAVLAAGIGLLRTRADYSPVLSGRIAVEYRAGRFGREQLYRIHRAVGPGALIRPGASAVPLFYRSAGKPWWTGPDRTGSAEPGTARAFRYDVPEVDAWEVEVAVTPGEAPTEAQIAERPVLRLLERARPARGRWAVFATRGMGSLQGDSVLARLVLIAQR